MCAKCEYVCVCAVCALACCVLHACVDVFLVHGGNLWTCLLMAHVGVFTDQCYMCVCVCAFVRHKDMCVGVFTDQCICACVFVCVSTWVSTSLPHKIDVNPSHRPLYAPPPPGPQTTAPLETYSNKPLPFK